MYTGAGAQAAINAMMNSVKAMGPIVSIDPQDFITLLHKQDEALVVTAEKGVFGKKRQYLMPYRGLYLYTETKDPFEIPSGVDIISAKSLWIPSV